MAVERTHEEIQELLGAFALDATDAEESAAVEAHLESCPWCREEVRQHREVAAVLAGGIEPAPSGLWERIAGSIEGDEKPSMPAPRPLGPVPAPGRSDDAGPAPVVPTRSSSGARRWLVAAAIVLVVGVVGALVGVVLQQQGEIDDLDRAVNTTTTLTTGVPAERTATLVNDDSEPMAQVAIGADGTARIVEADGMAPLDAEHVYQVWGVAGEETISLAVLSEDPTEVPFVVPDQVTTIAVTEERSPGVVASEQPAVAAGEVV